ncbi:hypothetical protein IGI04_022978 [Brassica rapa subsp. trilocularis]|uniref:Uncharacterized protein n=1 Tax=Brassica rapa subsp. trilocularis TaxID=1813537 RepID=A0ABQ7M2H5_BRACM|nr:hypothetical protein IGI04_022978 [Brassica rapa subsp. trilocularis]
MAATKMFLIIWYSSSTNLKVFQIWKTSGTTYLLVVWKSSGLSGSLLTKSSDKVVWTSWKSSGLPKSLLKKSSGLPGSRLEVSSGLPGSLLTKSSSISNGVQACLCRGMIYNCFVCAHIRLLQAHRISNDSDPPIIVSFYDFMNHKKCKIKILCFLAQCGKKVRDMLCLVHKNEKKKGNSILGALRASNWLFMVVRVLMTMVIL